MPLEFVKIDENNSVKKKSRTRGAAFFAVVSTAPNVCVCVGLSHTKPSHYFCSGMHNWNTWKCFQFCNGLFLVGCWRRQRVAESQEEFCQPKTPKGTKVFFLVTYGPKVEGAGCYLQWKTGGFYFGIVCIIERKRAADGRWMGLLGVVEAEQ